VELVDDFFAVFERFQLVFFGVGLAEAKKRMETGFSGAWSIRIGKQQKPYRN